MILRIIIGLIFIKRAVGFKAQFVIGAVAGFQTIFGHAVPGLVSMFGTRKRY